MAGEYTCLHLSSSHRWKGCKSLYVNLGCSICCHVIEGCAEYNWPKCYSYSWVNFEAKLYLRPFI